MNLECALQQAHLYYQSQNIQSARKVYRQILRHDPMCAQAWNRLGIIAYELGRPEIGVELIKQALDINPNQPEFLVNFGQMLMKLDRFSEAVEAFRGALSTDLDDLDTISNLGICLMKEHRVDEAIQVYQDSLKNNPGSAQIYENLGRVFEEIGLLENSIQAYQCATRLDPEIGTTYAGLARVLYAKGSLEESIKNYRYALKYVPEDALTYNNLGGAYKENGQFDEAVQAYQKAISINPENAEVQNNLGNTFRECGRFDEAIQAYQKAIDTNSQYADSHTNLGTLLLMHGNFECGWKKHEWRWKSDKFVKDNKRFFPHPLWVGCQLMGKSVVIWLEQGVGDQIMYASLLPKLQQQAHRILVETQQRLVPLFRRSFPEISFFRIQDPPNSKLLEESIDYQLPIGSLARWLLPDEESFPKNTSYLKACVNKVKELRDKYQQLES
nr:tetratricopeptide repeat protein [Candidatus Poribacteria bacterium]